MTDEASTPDATPPESSGADDIIRYSFLVVFATDKIIDEGEFEMLQELALRDGPVVDDAERAALSAIFARADTSKMDPEVIAEIEAFKAENHIP